MLRSKIFQVRVEHPEEKIDIHRWLRDFENALVSASRTGTGWFTRQGGFAFARIRKCDREREFAGDEINAAQPEHELLEKSPQNEKQRLGGFGLLVQLKNFFERFPRLDEIQQTPRLSTFTEAKSDRFIAQPGVQLLF